MKSGSFSTGQITEGASWEMPDKPLRIKVCSPDGGRFGGGIRIPREEFDELLQFVAWSGRKPPPIPKDGGRSAFARRDKIEIIGNIPIGGYKIKGVGSVGANPNEGSSYWIYPPQTRVYKVAGGLVHMGIDANGVPFPVPDSRKPLGGLSSGRGRTEFEIAQILHSHGGSCTPPIAWGQYPELLFNGSPMEWVILGLPSSRPERLNCYFDPQIEEGKFVMNSYLSEEIKKRNLESKPSTHLQIISDIYFQIGQVLRMAHEAGVVRFAGHTGNWAYIPETNLVVMHDLDSSVNFDDLPPKAKAMSIIKDIHSVVIGVISRSTHLSAFSSIPQSGALEQFNPIENFLYGYFGRHFSLKAEHKTRLGCIFSNILNNTIQGQLPTFDWITQNIHSEIYVIVFEILFEIYKGTELNKENPVPYDLKTLENGLVKFHQDANHRS